MRSVAAEYAAVGIDVEKSPAKTGINAMTFKALNDGSTSPGMLVPVGGFRTFTAIMQHAFTGGVADGVYKLQVRPYLFDGSTSLGDFDVVAAIPLGSTAASKVEMVAWGAALTPKVTNGTIATSTATAFMGFVNHAHYLRFLLQVTTATTSTTSTVSLTIWMGT